MPFIEGWLADLPNNFGLYYNLDTPPPLLGTGAGFWRGVVLFIRPGSGPNQEAIACVEAPPQPAAPEGGWRLFIEADGSLKFEIGANGGTFPAAQYTSFTGFASSPDQVTPALVMPILGVFRGDNKSINLHVANGGAVTASFVGLNYKDPTAGQAGTSLGLGDDQSNTTNPAAHLGINGLVGGPGEPDVTQIAQWFADVKTQLTTPIIAGMTDNRWTANPHIGPNEWQVPGPAVLPDQAGVAPVTAIASVPTPLTIRNYQVYFNY
jgi:hypothetical protein